MKKFLTTLTLCALAVSTFGQAGVKISAITPASSISGAEIVPLNQAGITKTATISQIVALAQNSFMLPIGLQTNLEPSFGSLLDWWDASGLATSNGAAITTWTSRISANAFVGAGTWDGSAVGGQPGVNFNGTSANGFTIMGYATAHPSLSNEMTLVVIFRGFNEIGPQGTLLATGNSADVGWYIQDAPNPNVVIFNSAETFAPQGYYSYGNPVNIFAARIWQGTNIQGFLNGKICDDSYLSQDGHGVAYADNLYLGQFRLGGGNYFNGSVATVLIYTNALTPANLNALWTYETKKYSRRALNVVLEGDSTTTGAGVTYGTNTLSARLAALLPGNNVDVVARGGRYITQQMTNAVYWLSTRHDESGKGVVSAWHAAINEKNIGLTTNQFIALIQQEAKTCHSNGWLYVTCPPISSATCDPSGYNVAVAQWIEANWQSYADGIADFYKITALSSNGACNGAFFSADHNHPADAAYGLMAPVVAAAINRVTQNTIAIPATYATATVSNLQTSAVSGSPTFSDNVTFNAGVTLNAGFSVLGQSAISATLLIEDNLSQGGQWIGYFNQTNSFWSGWLGVPNISPLNGVGATGWLVFSPGGLNTPGQQWKYPMVALSPVDGSAVFGTNVVVNGSMTLAGAATFNGGFIGAGQSVMNAALLMEDNLPQAGQWIGFFNQTNSLWSGWVGGLQNPSANGIGNIGDMVISVGGMNTAGSQWQNPALAINRTNGVVNAIGRASPQQSASTFLWSSIPPFSSTKTNFWFGTWTNGTFCCIWSNTANSFSIKQLAP